MTFDNPADIFYLLLLAVVPALAVETRKWFIALGGPSKVATAESLALKAVSAAEELAHKLTKAGETIESADKLKFAVNAFQQFAPKFGLKLTDEQVKALVEAALNQYRDVLTPSTSEQAGVK